MEKSPSVAEHNLLVVASYSKDTLKRVRDAFFDAGYTVDTWEEAATRALEASSTWRKTKIAHGKGSEKKSKKRGGTDTKVQECAEYLIDWAGNNPA